MCEDAEKSGMGVRYIRSRITEELDRQMFEDPDARKYTLFKKMPETTAAEKRSTIHEHGKAPIGEVQCNS